ncbi:peptidoglycan DD-metalloendopeptidase family protein [Candidatus Falkowbacteria bacterium]|nr:peptidoglycan DD-metalloendopeptidase family protein [Candidatus Falkowbacteria bacterium]
MFELVSLTWSEIFDILLLTMAIKQIVVKLVIFFAYCGKYLGIFFSRLAIVRAASVQIGRILFWLFIFPTYKLGYYLKYNFLKFYLPTRSRIFFILNRGYIVHVVLCALSFIIIVNNINAEELRADNYGEQTIIYTIIDKEGIEELTEETSVEGPVDKVLNYLDYSWTAEGQKAPLPPDAESADQLITDFSTITEGGTAVAKPNIIEPVKIGELPGSTASRPGVVVYTVQEGETVTAIAEKFAVSAETILWQNNLGVKTTIKAGDKLEILPVSGVLHKVKSGENIGSIAKKYNIVQDKIISANNLFDVNDIRIGQQLIIPGGKKLSPYVAKPRYASGSNVPSIAPISKLFIPPAQKITGEGMLWPTTVRRISQYYSWRHKAIDIAGPKGTPIYAADDGTVAYAGWSNGYGYNILLDHGNGVLTRYGHASKLYVEKGDGVVKGQTIGAIGSTGWSTGPHIHFEVRVSGVLKNPLSYVK